MCAEWGTTRHERTQKNMRYGLRLLHTASRLDPFIFRDKNKKQQNATPTQHEKNFSSVWCRALASPSIMCEAISCLLHGKQEVQHHNGGQRNNSSLLSLCFTINNRFIGHLERTETRAHNVLCLTASHSRVDSSAPGSTCPAAPLRQARVRLRSHRPRPLPLCPRRRRPSRLWRYRRVCTCQRDPPPPAVVIDVDAPVRRFHIVLQRFAAVGRNWSLLKHSGEIFIRNRDRNLISFYGPILTRPFLSSVF